MGAKLQSEGHARLKRFFETVHKIGRDELLMLLLLLVISLGSWGFAEIADEVMEGETHAFDEKILLFLRNPSLRSEPWGSKWLQEVARDITGLGGVAILTFLTLAAAGYLLLRKKLRVMWFLIFATGSGILVSSLLKHGFDRPRPELVPHGSYVYTTSFPSGHSMMSAIVYLTVGALLASVESKRRIRAYLMAIAVVLTVAIGISRVYLGVHWPTDVFAGWTGGATWAAACWVLANAIQRKGAMKRPHTEPT